MEISTDLSKFKMRTKFHDFFGFLWIGKMGLNWTRLDKLKKIGIKKTEKIKIGQNEELEKGFKIRKRWEIGKNWTKLINWTKKRPKIRFLMFSGSRIPLSNRGQFVEIQIPNDTFNFNDIGDEVYLDPLKSE